jgi:hypothetical protein
MGYQGGDTNINVKGAGFQTDGVGSSAFEGSADKPSTNIESATLTHSGHSLNVAADGWKKSRPT